MSSMNLSAPSSPIIDVNNNAFRQQLTPPDSPQLHGYQHTFQFFLIHVFVFQRKYSGHFLWEGGGGEIVELFKKSRKNMHFGRKFPF